MSLTRLIQTSDYSDNSGSFDSNDIRHHHQITTLRPNGLTSANHSLIGTEGKKGLCSNSLASPSHCAANQQSRMLSDTSESDREVKPGEENDCQPLRSAEEFTLKERFTIMRNRLLRQESAEDDDEDSSAPIRKSASCKRCKYEVAASGDSTEIIDDLSEDSCDSQDEHSSICDKNQVSDNQARRQSQSTVPVEEEKIIESADDFYRKKADENLKNALLGSLTTKNSPVSQYKSIQISSNFDPREDSFKKPYPPPPLKTSPPMSSISKQSSNARVLFPISRILASTTTTTTPEPPSTSMRSATPESLVDNYKELLDSLVTRASVQCTRLNLKSLNLVRKETLLSLIDRNRSNNILAPFDLFAYGRLKSKLNNEFLVDSMNNLNICNYSMQRTSADENRQLQQNTLLGYADSSYNFSVVHKLDKLRKYYRPNERNYMKENSLLLNSVSSFLMPFFFDIFNASELQSFNKETVDMLLLLKRSYKAQENPSYELLSSNYIENILWNCFAVYKYKFEDDDATRMGLLNYFLTYVSLLNELETLHKRAEQSANQPQTSANSEKSFLKKFEELNTILPFLLEALVMNGLFKSSDLSRFQGFYTHKRLLKSSSLSRRFSQSSWKSSEEEDEHPSFVTTTDRLSTDLIPTDQSTTTNFEANYLDNSMRRLLNSEETNFPLKLKNLCRICIKKSMKDFTAETVGQLNIPNAIKPFMLYDEEVSLLFRSNKRFLSVSASKCSWY